MVTTGLESFLNNSSLQKKYKGNIALLCHSASIDTNYTHTAIHFKNIFKERLVKIFGPQHGFVTDVQDNMVETNHYTHPYFNLPIYSLYSETRVPTDEMLEGIDVLFIDLQDVGTRVYTYISTVTYILKKCSESKKNIKIVLLDRPNPVGGEIIEGNVLEQEYSSFVGVLPIPQRHAMTMAEVASFAINHFKLDSDFEVIKCEHYQRNLFYEDTRLPWVFPSPNLPTAIGSLTFVGTVLFEGTNVSEGRGTTRSLEILGHPDIEPFSFCDSLTKTLKDHDLRGQVLRPLVFMPTFQKHAGVSCGGFQIHVTDKSQFRPWKLSQVLCQEFYNHLGTSFKWKDDAYEYEHEKLAIDLINGTNLLRLAIENNNLNEKILDISGQGHSEYLNQRENCLLY